MCLRLLQAWTTFPGTHGNSHAHRSKGLVLGGGMWGVRKKDKTKEG